MRFGTVQKTVRHGQEKLCFQKRGQQKVIFVYMVINIILLVETNKTKVKNISNKKKKIKHFHTIKIFSLDILNFFQQRSLIFEFLIV